LKYRHFTQNRLCGSKPVRLDFVSYCRKPQIWDEDVLIYQGLTSAPNMSQCPDCGCDLPSFQTLCSKCYDARYSEEGRPKSLLDSIRPFGSNPRRRQVLEDRINDSAASGPRLWPIVLAVALGVGFDWHCGFGWFAGRYSPFSATVLCTAGLIAAYCGAGAVLAACLISRARWRDASYLFFVFSLFVWNWFWADWIAGH